jgi:hypothetical protein
MKEIVITDLYHQRGKTVPDDMVAFLFRNGRPIEEIFEAVRGRMESSGFDNRTETREGKLWALLAERQAITISDAVKAGALSYHAQFTAAMVKLREEHNDIGVMNKRKPHIYYYGVSELEAIGIVCETKSCGRATGQYILRVEEVIHDLCYDKTATRTKAAQNDKRISRLIGDLRTHHQFFRFFTEDEIMLKCMGKEIGKLFVKDEEVEE